MLPAVAALVNVEHRPFVDDSETHLSVTEECRLLEDEPQQIEQTFTLLARCCMH